MTEEYHYLTFIPKAVPPGQVVVHHHVSPVLGGTAGFRFWLQAKTDRLEVCPCEWAPELPEHYRIKPIE